MSCKDYLELKPGMEVKLSYEPWGYKNVDAVIDSVGVKFHCDEENNCGVFHPIIVCYTGKCRLTFNGPSVWETLVIKPCRKVQVKNLFVGDVIERGIHRGFVKYVGEETATIQWFNKLGLKTYDNFYGKEIDDAEVVGHVDLWNLLGSVKMEDDKSIGKLYCDVEVRVNGSKYNPFNKLENISTKDLVEELKKRIGVETFVVGVEDRYLLHLIYPEYHGCGTRSEEGPATILIITD